MRLTLFPNILWEWILCGTWRGSFLPDIIMQRWTIKTRAQDRVRCRETQKSWRVTPSHGVERMRQVYLISRLWDNMVDFWARTIYIAPFTVG